MVKEKIFEDINEFRDELRAQGITKIAFGQVNEQRAEQVELNKLEVVRVVRLELLAYKGDTLYKCVKRDVDLDTVYAMLCEDNFDVTRRSQKHYMT